MVDFLFNAFNLLFDGISAIGRLIFDIGAVSVYVLSFVGQAVGLIVQILYRLLSLLFAYGEGLINSIQSISSINYSVGGFSSGWLAMQNVINLSVIGWALAGIVWMIVAVGVLRAIRGR